MRDKRALAVDFDDVCNNFNAAFLRYNQIWNGVPHSMRYEDLTDYIFHTVYGVEIEEINEWIWHFCRDHHDDFLKPIGSALAWLRVLRENYEIHMVTSRCESIQKVTRRWLDNYATGVFDQLHFTNGFATRYPGRRRNKLSVCREIGAVAFVDDALGHVEAVAAGLQVPTFMLTQPWNKSETPTGVIRAQSWDEIGPRLIALSTNNY